MELGNAKMWFILRKIVPEFMPSPTDEIRLLPVHPWLSIGFGSFWGLGALQGVFHIWRMKSGTEGLGLNVDPFDVTGMGLVSTFVFYLLKADVNTKQYTLW
jgi:hypothetical protein